MADEELIGKSGSGSDKKSRKELKKEEKRKKKLEKKGLNADDSMDDESSAGGKVAVFFATIIIIAIWLAIFVLLIKLDVGGFGSTVMYPILKDVPYVNKILPDVTTTIEEDEGGYTTIGEANDYIKQLEAKITKYQDKVSKQKDQISDLKAQVSELSQYKDKEAEFEKLKQKFDEEVVFSDNAPDISNYQTYYESIDPDNAEAIYKQVVEQEQYSDKVTEYAKTYSSMKPKQAAAIFDTMTDQLELVAEILDNMDAQSRANILGNMTSDTAAKVTAIMKPTE